MIVTLTLNPIVDYTITLTRVHLGQLHRLPPFERDVSGKGINVSVALHRLQQPSVAVVLLAGERGRLVYEEMRHRGIDLRPVWFEGETRMAVKVYEQETSRLTELNERGPAVTEAVLEEVVKQVHETVAPGDTLIMAGSTPPGTPADYYARLVRDMRARDVRCIVDAEGDALRLALEQGVALLKPNRAEAGHLLGRSVGEDIQVWEALEALSDHAPATIVTLGADGLVASTPEGRFRARPPAVNVRSTAGCGDALLASVVWGREQGWGWEKSLRWAVAASAATAELSGTKFPDENHIRRLLDGVQLERG